MYKEEQMRNYSYGKNVVSSSSSSSGGIGFTGLLQITFIILKLCRIIDWSWWWVLAPTWIAVLIFAVVVGIVLAVAFFSD